MAATISLADDLAAVAHAAGRRDDHINGAGRLDARGGLWQSVGGTPALLCILPVHALDVRQHSVLLEPKPRTSELEHERDFISNIRVRHRKRNRAARQHA